MTQASAPSPEIGVIATGIANIASVLGALRRAGATPRLVERADEVRDAPLLVLPGVGSFGAGLQRLDELGIRDAIAARVNAERPTLAICLGFQLLCARSEESPGARGIGVIDAPVERFRTPRRIPQFGWNTVEPDDSCAVLRAGHAYFANSYRVASAPEGWAEARSVHGEPFIAALERGPVLACQFHPELSGAWGGELFGRWIARSLEVCPC